jgi:hypothetical protein
MLATLAISEGFVRTVVVKPIGDLESLLTKLHQPHRSRSWAFVMSDSVLVGILK